MLYKQLHKIMNTKPGNRKKYSNGVALSPDGVFFIIIQ